VALGQRADLADDRRPVLVDVDRRARRDAVVAPDRRLTVRKDVHLRLLLRDGEVVDAADRRLGRRGRRLPRKRERLGQLALRQTVRDGELRTGDALGRQHQCCAAEQTHLEEVATAEFHDSL
jgi:hypothetical protein